MHWTPDLEAYILMEKTLPCIGNYNQTLVDVKKPILYIFPYDIL